MRDARHPPSPPSSPSFSSSSPPPLRFRGDGDGDGDDELVIAWTHLAANPPLVRVYRTLDIPLPTERLATTALKALQVDPELSQLVTRKFSIVPASEDGSNQGAQVLRVEYNAATNRMLRVAVNSFMDSLKLVLEVMEQLDADVLGQSKETGQPN